MKKLLGKMFGNTLLPFLAFIFAFFIGGIIHLDSNADNVSVYSDGNSNSKLTLTDFGLFAIISFIFSKPYSQYSSFTLSSKK